MLSIMNRMHLRLALLAGALAAALLAGAGCGGSGSSSNDGPPGPGTPDITTDGILAVNELALAGAVQGNQLTLQIPVEAVARAATGELTVALREVSKTTSLSHTKVEYDLKKGEKATLAVSLPKPAGLDIQPDLVNFNLFIQGEGKVGVRINRSLLYVVPPFDLRLEGPRTLHGGRAGVYRVRAVDPASQLPLAGVPVELEVRQGGDVVRTFTATTAETGDATVEVEMEETGSYEVVLSGAPGGAPAEASESVSVVEYDSKLLLTTDKPLYQPGQTIHLRALALQRPNLSPRANEEITFEVEDGKGNKIHKLSVTTDTYGIASSTFKIGSIVNMGTFKVRALLGENIKSEKTVDVSLYSLPKFRLGVVVEKPWYSPGETLTGQIDAGYFFGKPVAGAAVTLDALTLDVGESVFQQVLGTTDANGKFAFSVTLPNSLVGLPLEQGKALVILRALVVDTADQQVQQERPVIVAQQPLDVTVVPEAGVIVPGIENRLLIFATDPLGAPLEGINITFTGAQPVTTDVFGQAIYDWTPSESGGNSQLSAAVQAPNGATFNKTLSFATQGGGANVLVRTDQAVYGVGDSVAVEILVSDPNDTVYIDWLNEGQVVDMRTLKASGGRATFEMSVDGSLRGSNRVEAYVVDSVGNVVRAGKTIFVSNDGSLSVELSTDKPLYAPGEPAKLTFTVKDDQGTPTAAALGVQIVDEAVFALIDARPGLLKTYFELEDAFAEPKYQIGAPPGSLTDLLFGGTQDGTPAERAAAQKRTEGQLAALGGMTVTGMQAGTWKTTLSLATQRLTPHYASQKSALLAAVKEAATGAVADLKAEGCTNSTWYCESMKMEYMSAVAARTAESFAAWDFWGNSFEVIAGQSYSDTLLTLRTNGPDEIKGTSDDATIKFSFSESGIPELDWRNWDGPQAGGDGGWADAGGGGWPGEGGAEDGGGPWPPSEPGEGEEGEGPRVRRDFPETLYVNPALIVGGDGSATVEVQMADSITEWRVSTLAHSMNGKLGGGQSGVKVFQEFFVDINFPATLTRGDEITFPIAVYNYLDTPQTVSVQMETADWFTPLGDTNETLQLAPGQVLGLSFPVRVEKVGLHTLTVFGYGSDKSDAVARMVRVVPDGKAVPLAQSGSLPAGSVSHDVSFPPNAVEGSELLYVNIYPGFLSQVVEGMDSMLQVPTGCFEQTTATTWPNVLVTDYMVQTGTITPDIQMKAESLISAGYQRLLTFEHPGGGFSWFGTSDPKPFLSVTAFGLMEFVDMSTVHEVDPAMVERTRQWIIAQQASDGSWPGDISEFFTFHTSSVRNTAFVLWSLATAGTTGSPMQQGVNFIKANIGKESLDSYTKGLVANALALAAPNDPLLAQLLQELDAAKTVEGEYIYWTSGDTQTPFYEMGDSANISATAMVTLAMIQAGGNKQNVEGALSWLLTKKDTLGNWSSTQATIWTLRALLMAAKAGTEGATGTLTVEVNGATAQTVLLTADKWDVMTTVDLTGFATTGTHEVALHFEGEGKVSYNLVSSFHVPWSDAPPEGTGVLSLQVSYDKTELQVNDTVEVTLLVTNNTANTHNMVLVDLGIPPGFEVLGEDLAPYIAEGNLSRFETTGKQLILYITELPGSSTLNYIFRLRATMPVKAADGGATAYLYYNPDERTSAESTVLEAAP